MQGTVNAEPGRDVIVARRTEGSNLNAKRVIWPTSNPEIIDETAVRDIAVAGDVAPGLEAAANAGEPETRSHSGDAAVDAGEPETRSHSGDAAEPEDPSDPVDAGDLGVDPANLGIQPAGDERDRMLLEELSAARESGDPSRVRSAEHALVLRFLPVANAVARRYRGRGVNLDDLQQQARLGLVQAVSRWQPGRGHAFLVFALPTMQGMIKRYFRDTITVVRRPRSTQENGPRIQRSLSELSHLTGRNPSNEELASHAGVTTDQLRQFQLSVVTCNPLPLDDVAVADRAGGGPDERLPLIENRRDLAAAWGRLTVRERQILTLRFWDELSQAQIGQRIGVTQTQVGRLIARAFAKLSAQMASAC